MPKIACVACGEMFAEGQLLYGDAGRICAACESDAQEKATARSTIRSLVIAGPLLSMGATAAVTGACIPFLGVLFAAMGPFVSLAALVFAGRAINAALNNHAGVGPNEKSMLLLSGFVTLPWALGTMGLSVVMLITTLIAVLTGF